MHPESLEQGGSGGARGCWCAGRGRWGQQEQEQKEEVATRAAADREHFPPRLCTRESAGSTASGTSGLVAAGPGAFAVLKGACPNPTVLEGRTWRRSQGGWSRVDLEGRAAGGRGPWRRISSGILGWGRLPGSKALSPKAGPAPQVWEQISRHWAESPGAGSVSQVGREGVLGGRIEDRDSEELVLHQAIPQRLPGNRKSEQISLGTTCFLSPTSTSVGPLFLPGRIGQGPCQAALRGLLPVSPPGYLCCGPVCLPYPLQNF